MNLNIKITGGGTAAEIAGALRQIAQELENGEHIVKVEGIGECEWEDSTLITTITEGID